VQTPDTALRQKRYGLNHDLPPLELDHMRTSRHQAGSMLKSFFRADLEGTERHVRDDEACAAPRATQAV